MDEARIHDTVYPDSEPTTVQTVQKALEQIAPPELAGPWDHIGLQVGRPGRLVSKVLLALDVTPRVVEEAERSGCQLIISHHPLIFEPLSRLNADVPEHALVMRLVRGDISVIAAHTNLDAAPGGVAESLLAALQLTMTGSSEGFTPYGRLAFLETPRRLSELLVFVRTRLGSAGCRINTDKDRVVSQLAVFPGSFQDDAMADLVTNHVELLICGEMKYHIGLALAARGIAVIDAGHDVTERVVLPNLAVRLGQKMPKVAFAVAEEMNYNKVAF